jgi:hypothetical protein
MTSTGFGKMSPLSYAYGAFSSRRAALPRPMIRMKIIKERTHMGKWLLRFIVGATVLTGALFLGAICYFDYAMTHRGWTKIDGDAAGNARSYADAPVLWVGEEFDVDGDGDLEPVSTFDTRGSDGEGLPDEIYIGYGRCKFPDYEGGCALPLSIIIEFTCSPIDEPNVEQIRGVAATRQSHLRLHSENVTITIYTSPARERAVADALHGANDLASHITTDSDLTNVVRDACRRS